VAVGKKGLKIVLPERTYEVEADETPQRDKWLQGFTSLLSLLSLSSLLSFFGRL